MSQPIAEFPPQRPWSSATAPVVLGTMQRRVQFCVLLQLLESGRATRPTTAVICPGTDRRDLESALEYLIADESIDGPRWHLDSLVELAESGDLTLTALGRLRVDEDDI